MTEPPFGTAGPRLQRARLDSLKLTFPFVTHRLQEVARQKLHEIDLHRFPHTRFQNPPHRAASKEIKDQDQLFLMVLCQNVLQYLSLIHI